MPRTPPWFRFPEGSVKGAPQRVRRDDPQREARWRPSLPRIRHLSFAHEQEARHQVPTHEHAWIVVEIASGAVVSGEPPAEELWMRHALTRFGDDAA